jgi:hypothetical protein
MPCEGLVPSRIRLGSALGFGQQILRFLEIVPRADSGVKA